jgi:excisionase family DNA binding protein
MTEQFRRKLASLESVANYLDCSVMSVRRRIASGELTGYRVGRTRTIRVDMNEVEALLRPMPTGGYGSDHPQAG